MKLFLAWAEKQKEECKKKGCPIDGPKRTCIECVRCYGEYVSKGIGRDV